MTLPIRRDDFASDNTAGICPEVWAALESANRGSCPAYGEDRLTGAVSDRIREIFETDCQVFLVSSGTAANALALAQLCQPFHSVICHRLAHIHTDECGSPEFFSGGSKLVLVDGDAGKISLDPVRAVINEQHGVHSHKPRVISLTQATELGTVYSIEDISEISRFAREQKLLVHMDGARFANAVASLNCQPKELTWQAGVDVLCFGGTKNGVAGAELVIFFRPELATDFDYRIKQAGQLGSKMRFLSAQWEGLLTNDVWLQNARRANNFAKTLEAKLAREANLPALFPVQANSVFVRLTSNIAERLSAGGWNFYKFVEPDVYRFMCSWATTEESIDEFVRQVAAIVG